MLFQGNWSEGEINGTQLTWNSGDVTNLSVVSDTKFETTLRGVTYTAELLLDGKLHWSDGDIWDLKQSVAHVDRHPTCFDGHWNEGTIHGNILTWSNGKTSTLTLCGDTKLSTTFQGISYTAELQPTGKLRWSDGDVWFLKEAITSAAGQAEDTDTGFFDGHWSEGAISGNRLTWNNGAESDLHVISRTEFSISSQGTTHTAELQSDGSLHWSDGDIWFPKLDALLESETQNTTSFDGHWNEGVINGNILTWNSGHVTKMQIASHTKFTTTLHGATHTAELGSDEKLHWSDGDVWYIQSTVQNTASFNGQWNQGVIDGNVLTWNSGETSAVSIVSQTKFSTTFNGTTYTAELQSDGKLHWSDGDVWESQQFDASASSQPQDVNTGLFNGQWSQGMINGIVLTWASGETSTLSVLSETKFSLNHGGVNHTAELQSDGNLHWSDGDIWIVKHEDRGTANPANHRAEQGDLTGRSSALEAEVRRVGRSFNPSDRDRTTNRLVNAFREVDTQGTGKIDEKVMRHVLTNLGFSNASISKVVKSSNALSHGVIDYAKFADYLFV